MKLHAIDETNERLALEVLERGFPYERPEFWRRGLGRARRFTTCDCGWPLGYLFEHADRAIGVILTFPSRRETADGARVVVNMSSWYVEPELRGLAPISLFRILGDRAPVYTNLTPLPQVLKMVEGLGFTRWNEGVIISSWPWTLKAPGTGSTVRSVARVPADALDPADRRILEDHELLGCVAAVLHDGSAYHPLIVARTRLVRSKRYRRIPVGHLIYAPSRKVVLANLRPITAFLLRRGLPLFTVDGDEDECPPGATFRRWGVKAYRGPIDRDRIDFAYSELVYFDLPPY